MFDFLRRDVIKETLAPIYRSSSTENISSAMIQGAASLKLINGPSFEFHNE